MAAPRKITPDHFRALLDRLPTASTTNSSESFTPPSTRTIVCFNPEQPDEPCPVCGGLGVVRRPHPVNHPDFGKFFRCPNYPVERDTERKDRLRQMSNLGVFHDKTFENFNVEPVGYEPNEATSLRAAYENAYAFAQNPQGWLLLEGTYGTGKTHLAAAIGNERLAWGEPVLFITAPDLLDHLRSGYNPQNEAGYDETFERLRSAPLLIIDDLGVENPSPWAQEKLFQLFNHRYSSQLATVITTNADLGDLDARIRSRLLDVALSRHVRITAPDYRGNRPDDDDPFKLLSQLHHYSEMTFDVFDVQKGSTPEEAQHLNALLRRIKAYAQNPQGWLLLMGDYGTGKTHLAAAIAQERQRQNESVIFVKVSDLLDYLRGTFSPDSRVTFDRVFTLIRECPLLVLDDVSSLHTSAWAREKLFQLVDYRYITRLPTVITTASTLEAMDKRLRTRFADTRLCQSYTIMARSYVDRCLTRSR
jgi:DNA replication protein DnaC